MIIHPYLIKKEALSNTQGLLKLRFTYFVHYSFC